MTLKTLLMCATSATLLLAGEAQAQAASANENATLEEVVVTAQRRTEDIQTIATAVAVLSSSDLEKKDVDDLRDLQNATPSLTINDNGILTFANIRGIGLNLSSPTVVSGVATYRDGLFAPSPLFLNESLFDIASIEVLRGPQGTFVGQNSTAGAIFQNSRSPELGGMTGYIQAEVANYNLIKLEGAVNLPVSDTFAVRLAVLREDRDSYYENTRGGPTPGDVHQSSARIGLLWKPTDAFQALFKIEYNEGESDGYAQQPIPGTRYAPLDPADPFVLAYDRTDTVRNERSIRNSLELRYVMGSGVTLRSVTGFQYGDQHFINDDDGTTSREAYEDQSIVDRVYSQEFNIISPEEGPFTWVLGGSYVRQTARLDLHLYNERFPFGTIFPRQDIFIYTLTPKVSTGVFAQATYDLTDRFEIEVGARYSRDKQKQSGLLGLFPTPPLPGAIDASRPRFSDENLTGKVALNFQATEDHFLYAFVANGFKTGGVDIPDGTFDSEKVVHYEAGWKATLAAGRVRTQLDAFYMDYKDLQLNVFNPFSAQTEITNVGKSTIWGVEAQMQGRFDALGFDFSAAYVKSELGDVRAIDTRTLPGGAATGLGVQCPAGVPSNPPVCFNFTPFYQNLSGRRNLYSPELTVSAGVEYAFELANGDTLTPRLDTIYIGDQSARLFENPQFDIIPSRQLWNVQLAYEHGDVRLVGYVTNVADEVYVSGMSGNNLFYGAPREYGVRVSRRF